MAEWVESDMSSGGVEPTCTIYELAYASDFDENGLFYFMGTRGKSEVYANPHDLQLVVAAMSSIHKGHARNVVSHSEAIDGEIFPNYTKNERFAWVSVDLGRQRKFLPNHYCLRHGGKFFGNALRSWQLQAKVLEADEWIVLMIHDDDPSMDEETGATASWPLAISPPSAGGYRYFRIFHTGVNSGGNDCLFCSGFELYGTLIEQSYI